MSVRGAGGPPPPTKEYTMAVAAPFSGRRDGRDACNSARFHSRHTPKKKRTPVAAPAQQHRRESERDRARGLVAHPSRTWDLDWTWVHASGHGEIRVRCPIIAIAQRLTHPPRFAPPGKRHRHFGPFRHDRPAPFFSSRPQRVAVPTPESGKKGGKKRAEVHTYVRTRGRGETLGALPAARRPRRRHHRLLRPIRPSLTTRCRGVRAGGACMLSAALHRIMCSWMMMSGLASYFSA